MADLDSGWVRRYLAGDRRPRRALLVSVVGVLGLASVAFLLGLRVGLYEFPGWVVILPGIALVSGLVGAGLVPTVGSLWLISLWGYTFPPLVGYLTGEWSAASRYTHPRLLGFAYGSARAELLGGLETGVQSGLLLSVIVGTIAYVAGAVLRSAVGRVQSSR